MMTVRGELIGLRLTGRGRLDGWMESPAGPARRGIRERYLTIRLFRTLFTPAMPRASLPAAILTLPAMILAVPATLS